MAKRRRNGRSGRWEKRTFDLSPQSRWTAKPGNNIFVADRGTVQFEVPKDWILKPNENSICFYDGEEPDDNIRLEMSVISIPKMTEIDGRVVELRLRGRPLEDILEERVIAGDRRGLIKRSGVRRMRRDGIEAVWVEADFMDPTEKRLAHSRMCLARGFNVQPLITMEFWPEDRRLATRVWDDVLETLKLGEEIENPFRGPLPS